MKRTFIAIKVYPNREFIDFYYSFITKMQGEIKWYEPYKLHLTLVFLGSTSNKQEEQIKKGLENVCAQNSPFTLNFQGLRLFSSKNEPRVIWIGLKNAQKLNKIYRELCHELVTSGISTERKKFTPHITIGRIKCIGDKKQLLHFITENQEIEIMKNTIREIIHYESTLTPKGSIYSVLGRFQLK